MGVVVNNYGVSYEEVVWYTTSGFDNHFSYFVIGGVVLFAVALIAHFGGYND